MQGGLMQLQACLLEDYVTGAYSDNGLVAIDKFVIECSLCWQSFFSHGRMIAVAPSSNKTEAPTFPFA
jgi:hypothetical protein